ncbi:cell wall-binding repeat-containing protein [Kineococcus esterisolvens]|uniref:cell wall-binding repeat-containing protein n=1 Tax=unclassified Kineococcus TaxID=2621656 RepID=UPI003D7E21BC
MLLTGRYTVPQATLDELERLGTSTTHLIGGTASVSTAVAVGQRFFPGSTAAVLAVGENYPDALAAGPFAANIAAPLLLTGSGATPQATRAELDRRGTSERFHVGAAHPS